MYRVLIVDDEKLMRDAMRAMVSRVEGFQVVDCVGTGEEAIEVCSREQIHVVFMDVMMPGISGIEASKAIYEQSPSTVIYIVSAHNNFELNHAALNAKVRDYVSKPVSFSIIAHLLEDYEQLQSGGRDQMKQLIQLLEERKYDQIFTVVPKIVEEMFQQEGSDKTRIHNRFLRIGREVLRAAEPIHEQGTNLETLFPLDNMFGHESVFWNFWLHDVMDYAFRKNAISKCEHLQAVFRLIDEKIREDINLSLICQDCSISQSYLSRMFRQHLGVSVMDYIHLNKLKHAKRYMALGNMNMTDIAYYMGYNEGSYFSKVFKKYEGITPQQYKNQMNF